MSSDQIQCPPTKSWWFAGNIKFKTVKCGQNFRGLDQIPAVRYRQNLDQENQLSYPNSVNLPKSQAPPPGSSAHQARVPQRGSDQAEAHFCTVRSTSQHTARLKTPVQTLTATHAYFAAKLAGPLDLNGQMPLFPAR